MIFTQQHIRHPTGAAIDRISADLRLGSYGQDWDIEVADAARVAEFIDHYESQQLDDDERFVLMSLIIASFDDHLSGTGPDDHLQSRIVGHLTAGFNIFNSLVQYWSSPDDGEEHSERWFSFTPIARVLMHAMYGDRIHWPRTPVVVKRMRTLLPDQGAYDAFDVADSRDGSFTLLWSKIAGRESGSRDFPNLVEALEFASREFAVPLDTWKDIE